MAESTPVPSPSDLETKRKRPAGGPKSRGNVRAFPGKKGDKGEKEKTANDGMLGLRIPKTDITAIKQAALNHPREDGEPGGLSISEYVLTCVRAYMSTHGKRGR